MEAPEVLVLQASYSNPVHADAIGFVLNHYAEDVMGGGKSLPADTLQQLAGELAKRPHAFSVLAFVAGQPVGLINCFEGFSTFACRPLVNIHDVAVIAQWRGKGISQKMLAKVEEIAPSARLLQADPGSIARQRGGPGCISQDGVWRLCAGPGDGRGDVLAEGALRRERKLCCER